LKTERWRRTSCFSPSLFYCSLLLLLKPPANALASERPAGLTDAANRAEAVALAPFAPFSEHVVHGIVWQEHNAEVTGAAAIAANAVTCRYA